MIKLQHIAIAVHDPEEAAKFFTSTLEMHITRRSDGPLAQSCFLSDGTIELAFNPI